MINKWLDMVWNNTTLPYDYIVVNDWHFKIAISNKVIISDIRIIRDRLNWAVFQNIIKFKQKTCCNRHFDIIVFLSH